MPVAWKVQPGIGILELAELQHGQHHVMAHQHGIHGVGIKLRPEVQQCVIAQSALAAADGIAANLIDVGALLLPSPSFSTFTASSRCIRPM